MTLAFESDARTDTTRQDIRNRLSRLAKYRPADTSGHLIRHRLFAMLDAAFAESSMVWISAPAGAGKSAALSAYANHRPHSLVWYRVDEADNDPQTMQRALAALASHPYAVPEANPFQAGHPYEHLDADALIVFDDVHLLTSAGSVALLIELVRHRPLAVRLCFLSRDSRPHWWSETGREAAALDWNALRLSRDEALALAPPSVATAPEVSASWLQWIDGWAAATAILRDAASAVSGGGDSPATSDAHHTLDQFFCAELLDSLPLDARHCLAMLSVLERFSIAEAYELTQSDAAAPLLQSMSGTSTFVYAVEDAAEGAEELLRFHPLLRAHLRREARHRLGAEKTRTLACRAATMLVRRGEIAAAVPLWREGGDWARLADTLETQAHAMIRAGDGFLWRQWKNWLPDEILQERPALWFWEGALLNALDGKLAREALHHAQSLYASRSDTLGRLRCIALIVDNLITHYDHQTAHLMRDHVVQIKAGLAQIAPESLSADDDILIHSRLVVAIVFAARRDCVSLYRAVQRCVAAMPHAQDDETRLTSGICILIYAPWFPFEQAAAFIDMLAPLATKETVSPLMRAWWHLQLGRWHFDFRGDLARVEASMHEAETIAKSHDFKDVFAFHLDIGKLLVQIAGGDLTAAALAINAMRPRIAPARQADSMRFMMAEATFHSGRGDLPRALELAIEVFRDDSRIAPSELPRFARLRAALHAMAADYPACEHWSQRAIDAALCHDVDVSIQSREVLRAYARIRNGNGRGASAILSQVLSRTNGALTEVLFARLPAVASVIAGFALEEGIESERMTAIIQRQRLLAVDPANPAWPWRIAVRTLGPLEIMRDAKPVGSAGKLQQRPLLLLKALMVAGPAGRPIHILADQLWPDSEDARAAMNTTLHRLRKLLGHDDSVRLRQSSLSLDPGLVWSDVEAFLTVCERIDILNGDTDAIELIRHQSLLCRLYRGPLGGSDTAPWLCVARDRYRNMFVNACARLGGLLESCSALPEANALYREATAAEPLAEVIYRGLMRCSAQLEGKEAAAAVYRRCRETLSVILGSQPSAETVALARSIAEAPETGFKGPTPAGDRPEPAE